MTRRIAPLAVLAALLLPSTAGAQQPDVPLPAYPGSFEQIGHEPLMNRGMNSALAVYGGYAYVGSRTDGTHANAGVLVVDVRNPAAPEVVHEIGPPDEGLPTQSSRELRILPDQKLLLVLNHQCSELIHRCASPSTTGVSALPSNIKIYDIAGERAAEPELVATYEPADPAQGPQLPHEFFVWSDPKRPGRVLVFQSVPNEDPNLVVTDFSRAREGVFTDVARFTLQANDDGLHSMTVSNDGRRMFISDLTGGVLVADTSELADNKPDAKITQLTAADDAPTWPGPGAHSTIQLPGRPGQLMVTDEVYGKFGGALAAHGCPWGWVRFVDATNPAQPVVSSEYKLPVNEEAFCGQITPDRDNFGSLAAHNPTLTEHLALLSWHGAGMQAINTAKPAAPAPAAGFMPTPLPAVQTEDPALSLGQDKVVMWSFPSIVDGLVYVVDVRNGLYILRYKGPYEEEVARVKYLDGASNSGDVQRMEPVAGAPGGPGAGRPGGTPAVGGPAPCLFAPMRVRGGRLGPFALRMTLRQAELRGGPPGAVRRRGLSWCVRGSGKVGVAVRKGRVALIATSARSLRGAGRLTPGRRVAGRNRLVIRRGKKVSRVALVRRGKVRWSGVVAGRPRAKAVRALAKAAGV